MSEKTKVSLLLRGIEDIDPDHLSNPKPGHTTGGSGRSARRSGWAGSDKIGCQQNYSPRKQKSTVLSKPSKKRRFNVSPEARTSEILSKPTKEQNQPLINGLSAVYHRDEKGFFLAAEQWNDAFLSLKTLFMQGMSGNLRRIPRSAVVCPHTERFCPAHIRAQRHGTHYPDGLIGSSSHALLQRVA